jgi:beta-lactamase class D
MCKKLVWKHKKNVKHKHKKSCVLKSQIIKSDLKTHNLESYLKH